MIEQDIDGQSPCPGTIFSFLNSFFWSPEWLEIPRDCNVCRVMGCFFQGRCIVYVVPCLYGLLEKLEVERSVFMCMHYSHASSIHKYSSTYFFSQSSMLTVFQRIFQNILAQTKRSCLQDP